MQIERLEIAEDSERNDARELFDATLGPLLKLMRETEGAEEVVLNGDELWLALGDEWHQLSWTDLGKLTPSRMRSAVRNAAVFGSAHYGARLPAVSTMTVKVPPCWRVSAAMPPSSDRWHICIRHLLARQFTLDDYVTAEIMTTRQKDEITELALGGGNILISGGTRAGKTTLLGSILRLLASRYRLIIAESTPELVVHGRDVVMLQECPGRTLADQIVQSLRMSPERLAVGEVRGPDEALEMTTAANTGHDGIVSTIHSNGAERAIDRLVTQCRKLQPAFSREEVAGTVDAVVQISGFGKSRRVQEIWRPRKAA